MRDITLEDTIYFDFTTRAFATGIPGTLGGTPVLSVLEENNATPITAGVSVDVDRASVTGLNMATIVATAANGYEDGKGYSVYISTGTVDSVSVIGEVVAQFTIGASAAAIDLANGTDGLGAIKTDSAAILIDTNEVQGKLPTNQFMGSSDGEDDDGNIATILIDTTEIGVAGVGLTNLGGVSTAMRDDIADGVADEVFTGAAHNVINSFARRLRQLQDAGSYNGGIYVDTVNGSAGTTPGENGTDRAPVDNMADANTLAASENFSRFFIAPGSSVTFAASQENQTFLGINWTLALGGQAISGSHFTGANISGIGTGTSEAHFDHCEIGAVTVDESHFDDCDITATATLSEAAVYHFNNCNHGGGTPLIDFGAAIGNTTVHVHGWQGACNVSNMGQAGTDVLHFTSSNGLLTLNSNNIGGTVHLNGVFALVNNGSGQTINQDGRVNRDVSLVLVDTAEIGVAGAGLTDLGGMSSGMKTEVNDEVKDVTDTDTSGQPGQGAPPATASLRSKMDDLHKAWRNLKTNDGTTTQLFADDGTTVDAKQTTSESGGTVTKSEWVTGP